MHLYAKFLNINKIKRNTDFECGIITYPNLFIRTHLVHNTTPPYFVDFCYFNIHSFCGSKYLAFLCYDMIGTHIFMGSGADAKHSITVSARHGVYTTHTKLGISSLSVLFPEYL